MKRPSLTPWMLLGALVGVAAGTGMWLLPAPLLAMLGVGAVLCFTLAFAFTADPPTRWRERTLDGRKLTLTADTDVDRVLSVAGAALQEVGVQRLEAWPGELIASRDSLGGREHVEVRLCTIGGVVHVDVRRRAETDDADGPDMVEHVVTALQAM